MQTADLVTLVTQGLILTLWLSLPTILVAAVVGTLFSLVQALTQIQEQTLSFAIKLVVVTGVLFLTARWMGGELYNYTVSLFEAFPHLAR